MSIALVVTRGYGNGTLTGTIPDAVRAGYIPGVPPPVVGNPIDVEPLDVVAIDSVAIDSEDC